MNRTVLTLVLSTLFILPVRAQESVAVRFAPDGMKPTELAERLVTSHPSVLAARERVTAAQGLRRQAAFRPNPSLDLDISTARAFTREDEGTRSASISQTFELGGKRRRRVDVANLEVQIEKSLAEHTERRLRAEVLTVSIDAITAHRGLVVLDEQLRLAQEFGRLIAARAREGEIAPLESDLTQVEVSRLEAQRALAQAKLGRSLAELQRLLPRAMLPVTLRDSIDVRPLLVSEADLRDRALMDRSDLRAVRLRTEQASGQVRLAQANRIPDLVGSLVINREVSVFENVLGTGRDIRDADSLLGFRVSIPLPFINRNQGNIQAAIASHRASRLDATTVEAAVSRDVATAYASYRAAQKATQLFREEVVQRTEKNLTVIREAYRLGQLRLLDLLNEQRKTIDLRLAAIDAERELALSAVGLEAAVGHSLGLLQ